MARPRETARIGERFARLEVLLYVEDYHALLGRSYQLRRAGTPPAEASISALVREIVSTHLQREAATGEGTHASGPEREHQDATVLGWLAARPGFHSHDELRAAFGGFPRDALLRLEAQGAVVLDSEDRVVLGERVRFIRAAAARTPVRQDSGGGR